MDAAELYITYIIPTGLARTIPATPNCKHDDDDNERQPRTREPALALSTAFARWRRVRITHGSATSAMIYTSTCPFCPPSLGHSIPPDLHFQR